MVTKKTTKAQQTKDEQAIQKKLNASIKKQRALAKENKKLSAYCDAMSPVMVILDNLVRAAETGDSTAIEQAAGAGREFLDQAPA